MDKLRLEHGLMNDKRKLDAIVANRHVFVNFPSK